MNGLPPSSVDDQSRAPAVFERQGHVGILTLNRPAALNAVNEELSAAVGDALSLAEADPDVRAIVVTGRGRAFCAGADLKNLAAGGTFLDPDHPERGFAGITQRFVTKPLIAAVNGHALGGGTEIVLACDLAVMSEDARLGLPEVTHGLIAAAGGLLRLPDQMPKKLAAQVILTGEPLSASSALTHGLVNDVVAADHVLPRALELAEVVARNAPLAVQASKRIMAFRPDHGSDWNPGAWTGNDAELDRILKSTDLAEGLAAFAEKRAPRWRGL